MIRFIYMLDYFESIFIMHEADVKQECGLMRSGKFLSGISLFDRKERTAFGLFSFLRCKPNDTKSSRSGHGGSTRHH